MKSSRPTGGRGLTSDRPRLLEAASFGSFNLPGLEKSKVLRVVLRDISANRTSLANWSIRFCAVLLGCVFCVNASASWLSSLGKTAERAGELAAKAGTKVARSGERAALATVDASGRLQVTRYVAGVGTLMAVSTSDDLIRLVDELGTVLQVTPDTLRVHESLFKTLLENRPRAVHVIDEDLATAPVGLATRAQRPTLVIESGEHLTFSVDAWSRRALLAQDLMEGLAARMRVIAIVPRTDMVLRQTFTNSLGRQVVFVETNQQLAREIRSAGQRLVVLAGHVENESFILRGAKSEVMLNESIESVHKAIDASGSIALMAGCNTACAAAVTGTTEMIDALKLAVDLKGAASGTTPLEFLEAIAAKTGSMHVDTDIYGGLRAVSATYVSGTERAVIATSVPTRLLISSGLSPYLTPFERGINLVVFFVVVGITGWLVLLVYGVTPKRGWKLVEEHWATLVERDDHEIGQINALERVTLLLLGPWIILAFTLGGVLHLIFNWYLSAVALMLYPAIKWLAPTILDIAHELAPEGDTKARPSFRDGREVALMTLLIWNGSLFACISVPSLANFAVPLILALFALAAILSILALQHWVRLLVLLSIARRFIPICLVWVLRAPIRGARFVRRYVMERMPRLWRALTISTQ